MDDRTRHQIHDLAAHRREPGSSETEKAARDAARQTSPAGLGMWLTYQTPLRWTVDRLGGEEVVEVVGGPRGDVVVYPVGDSPARFYRARWTDADGPRSHAFDTVDKLRAFLLGDWPPPVTEAGLRTEHRYDTALDDATRALADLGDWGGLDEDDLARTVLEAAGLPAILDALAAAEDRTDTTHPETP